MLQAADHLRCPLFVERAADELPVAVHHLPVPYSVPLNGELFGTPLPLAFGFGSLQALGATVGQVAEEEGNIAGTIVKRAVAVVAGGTVGRNYPCSPLHGCQGKPYEAAPCATSVGAEKRQGNERCKHASFQRHA